MDGQIAGTSHDLPTVESGLIRNTTWRKPFATEPRSLEKEYIDEYRLIMIASSYIVHLCISVYLF